MMMIPPPSTTNTSCITKMTDGSHQTDNTVTTATTKHLLQRRNHKSLLQMTDDEPEEESSSSPSSSCPPPPSCTPKTNTVRKTTEPMMEHLHQMTKETQQQQLKQQCSSKEVPMTTTTPTTTFAGAAKHKSKKNSNVVDKDYNDHEDRNPSSSTTTASTTVSSCAATPATKAVLLHTLPPSLPPFVVPKLWNVTETDQFFYTAGLYIVPIWLLLVLSVYIVVPSTSIEYLSGSEQTACIASCSIFATSIVLTCIPLLRQIVLPVIPTMSTTTTTTQSEHSQQPQLVSGILLCSLIIQTIAMITNGLLAFGPVPVFVDPITNARVFFIRWCEWIPLSGLMTCLTEGMDISIKDTDEEKEKDHHRIRNHHQNHHHRHGYTTIPLLLGIGQSISCIFGGIIPPLCSNLSTWYWSMIVSFIFFLPIFPRLYYKYQRYNLYYSYYWNQKQQQQQQNTNNNHPIIKAVELETYHRIQTGYHLLAACCICWTILVFNYFIVMWGMRNYQSSTLTLTTIEGMDDIGSSTTDTSTPTPTGWWSLWWIGRIDDSIAMVADTIFDVIAKCVYMNIIQAVHESTFDGHGRIRRQLEELRRMMTTLWENSTDVIVISTRQQQQQIHQNNNRNNRMAEDDPSKRSRSSSRTNPDRIITFISPTFTSMVMDTTGTRTITGLKGSSGVGGESAPIPTFTTSSSSFSCLPALIVTGELDPLQGLLLDFKVHAVDVKSIDVPSPMMDHPAFFPSSSSSPPSSSSSSEVANTTTTTTTTEPTTATVSSSAAAKTLPFPVGFEDQFEPHQRELLYEEARRLVHALYHSNAPTREEEKEKEDSKYDPNFFSHDVITFSNTTTKSNKDEDDDSPSAVRCELKLTQMDPRVTIAVVRDVTERHRRFDAERRALLEALARQKDAQSVNRFTRHEVKNGLLAGIEMCNYLCNASDDLKIMSTASGVPAVSLLKGDRLLPLLSPRGRLQNQQQQQQYDASSAISRHVRDLERKLHKTLDTVLAEAIARDVVHGKYRLKLEPVDVFKLFSDFSCAYDDEDTDDCHFTVQVVEVDGEAAGPTKESNDAPPLLLCMDPQLLKCIHRNAISSAVKNGALKGIISTNIRYWTKSNTLEVDVVSAPGPQHDGLIGTARSAYEDRRPHPEDGDGYELDCELDSDVAEDRAWIMQACAKTLGGVCAVRFEQDQKIFSFSCPAIPHERPTAQIDEEELESVPPPSCTWGIGIDDAGIQRRILARILSHMGIQNSKSIVFGKTPEESEDMVQKTLEILEHHPEDYVLMLVDENLDYDVSHGRSLSGSKIVEELRAQLEPSKESRLLALIRSANDSAGDIDLYRARSHGFFPKSTMKKEDVNQILTPIWRSRFPRRQRKNHQPSCEEIAIATTCTITSDSSSSAGLYGVGR